MRDWSAPVQIIEVSGYTAFEKTHIARSYLEPTVRKACAIPEGAVELTDSALAVLIESYCRESGVRNLKKQLEKVYRKVALRLATSEQLEVRRSHWAARSLARLLVRAPCLCACAAQRRRTWPH